MVVDKARAINQERRIPEISLFILSFIGGFSGVILGAFMFHHKTSKPKFLLVVFASVAIWAVILERFGFLGCLRTFLG